MCKSKEHMLTQSSNSYDQTNKINACIRELCFQPADKNFFATSTQSLCQVRNHLLKNTLIFTRTRRFSMIFAIVERAAPFAPTFATQCRVELFGRNIAGAELGHPKRP